MKKLFLVFIGCLLLWVTAHVILEMGGGVAAWYRSIEYRWYVYDSNRRHDPGQCAKIHEDSTQGKPNYLQDKCFYDYMNSHMSARNECGADRIIVDSTSITHMNKSDWLRQECLLSYYKKIFGSSLAKNIPICQNLNDQLIEFSYYRQNIRSNVDNLSTTQNTFVPELDLFEACENKIKNTK